MKKVLFETSLSRIYILIVCLVCLILLGNYFSYAMFTVSKEKSNAISIITGNLTYDLKIDGENMDTLIIPANSSKEFIITLNNPNNRTARFNFYYKGDLPDGVDAGYIEKDGYNIPPTATGINLEKNKTTGSSNIYLVKVSNISDNEVTLTLGVEVGLDYNDLILPSNGNLFRKIKTTGLVSEVLKDNIMNRLNYTDPEQTFITGEDPDNYIWYSGKLWRAVSIDSSDNSVKLITQWNISAINYSSGNSSFADSFIEEWLNDTSVDGFLGNLRAPKFFIKMNSVWNATEAIDTTKPSETTMVTDAVGLLNLYEYTMSYSGTDYRNGYLNNGLWWWTITPYDLFHVFNIYSDGNNNNNSFSYYPGGIRPSININPTIKIVSGEGTINDPYRLEGDNDKNLSGTLLSSRYSGEYITFGTGENNLYRIVSHETGGLTKITSAEGLKKSGNFITLEFGNNATFSKTNTVGAFLNSEYLTQYIGSSYSNMIENNTAWYLGIIGDRISYKLAKYTNTTDNILTSNVVTAKVGLLRFGELMAGQFDKTVNNTNYWILNPYNLTNSRIVNSESFIDIYSPSLFSYSVRPAMNLKSNVIITGGDGTKENPFTIALS